MPKKKKGFWNTTWRATKAVSLGVWSATKATSRGISTVTKWTKKKVKESNNERKRPVLEPKHTPLQELQKIEGSFTTLIKHLHSRSVIGIILGARGTGKSALGLRLLENHKAKTKKTVYALGFQRNTLPKWITHINSVDEVKNNGVVLVDEGGITFSSRKSMSNANTLLSELLFISRHKNLSVLFIAQNSSNLEINTLRQADILFMKPSALLQKDFERKKIQEIYKDVETHFKAHQDEEGTTYIHSNWYRGFVSNALPSFWSDDVSRSWK